MSAAVNDLETGRQHIQASLMILTGKSDARKVKEINFNLGKMIIWLLIDITTKTIYISPKLFQPTSCWEHHDVTTQ